LKNEEDLRIANRTLLAVAEGLASLYAGNVNKATIQECRGIMKKAVRALLKGWK